MPSPRLLVLVAAVSVVLIAVVGASRTTYEVGSQEVSCPDRVWSSAISSLTDPEPDPCSAAAQSRLFAVTAGLMGLVLISGLLSRRR